MRRLLDTDVAIDLLRKNPNVRAWFVSLSEPPAVPGFVAMELLQGCQNASDRRDVDAFLRPLAIVWPSETDMRSAQRHYHDSMLSSGIGLLDCLIAFTAAGRSDSLCTFNVKHYRTVTVLTTERPYVRT
jgi:predicted nucleic acid-binding protein